MADFTTYSAYLYQHLALVPPTHLYHYTSPDALIGIISNKQLWATNTMFLNDSKEINYAVETTRFLIDRAMEHGVYDQCLFPFLKQLREHLGSFAPRSYVISFTELQDSLSQWRAYCPPTGGYAVGFPSDQIASVAPNQQFKLVKCLYDWQPQVNILNEFINSFVKLYEDENIQAKNELETHIFLSSCRDVLGQVAMVMKHNSFAEEKEWRLISFGILESNNPSISFRASAMGVIPYFKFNLISSSFPDLVRSASVSEGGNLVIRTGPSSEPNNRAWAAQYLVMHHLGMECAFGPSDIPYKTW